MWGDFLLFIKVIVLIWPEIKRLMNEYDSKELDNKISEISKEPNRGKRRQLVRDLFSGVRRG